MSDSDKTFQLVTFQLGRELYGINIMDVREIVKLQDVRTIPNAPGYVEGIINLRSEIIPIISLHKRFRLERLSLAQDEELLSGFLIIELIDTKLGVRIDKISRVVTIESDEVQAPPQMLTGIGREYIRGVTNEKDGYLIILDVHRLFDRAELQQIGTLSG